MTPLQMVQTALGHLNTAIEDCESAAASLPNGNKADQALTQLREATAYLGELTNALQWQTEGMRLLADGANAARREKRLAELQARFPPTPEQAAYLAPFIALRDQLVAQQQAKVAAGVPCEACGTTMVLPGLPAADSLGPLAHPQLVADAAMALTRRLGFDWCGYQVGMHDSKPMPLIQLQGDSKP